MIVPRLLILLSAAPPLLFAQGPIIGSWRVSGSRCPGICAMSNAEAGRWRGKVARYTPSVARFGSDSCTTPTYASSRLTGRAFMNDFLTSLKSIGITADSVDVIEIGCHGRWTNPGAFLIIKDRGHILTVWDGVFFEMVRLATYSRTSERPNKRLKLAARVGY